MKNSPEKATSKTKLSTPRRKLSTPAAAGAADAAIAREKPEPQCWRSGARQRIRPETRAEMLDRLTNPQISLHETGVILRVCGATVRHYCDAGYLPHRRTPGGQRRFYLRDVLAFLREREAEKRNR